MTDETIKLRQDAMQAKADYMLGRINQAEAKKRVEPYIQAVNEKAKQLAKKYNQRPKLVSTASFLR